LIHEPSEGNGVRYWVISSQHGVLQTGSLHQSQKRVDVEAIDVEAGDTLDFVVDVYGALGYDQYLWAPELRPTDSTALSKTGRAFVWNAARDFTERRSLDHDLGATWGRFVQAALMSNELLFVD
jgi:hypothetical protein